MVDFHTPEARAAVALPPGLDEVRVRFAPSPTGSLHIGGARLMMYNVLFAHGQAKRAGKKGSVILRIEDTDQKRFVEGAAEGVMEGLKWLGLLWDEGPDAGGPYGPYVQSERQHHYREVADRLVESGNAYHCFCTPERLQEVRDAQIQRNLPPGYDRHCRDLATTEVRARRDAGESSVIRFRMPLDGETRVVDLLRGEIIFRNDTIEDLVLLKSDGFPTYHLAVVVDDRDMKITHVTRGPEWIPTWPIHYQIYRALGWEMPIFAHMPLILSPTGGKLSKRDGAASLADFKVRGYLPEALLNYLALLGWSLDGKTEFFTIDDLLEHFTIERVSAAPSTFDRDKLDWINQQWINHHITAESLAERVLPFLVAAGTIEDRSTRRRASPIWRRPGRLPAPERPDPAPHGSSGPDVLLPPGRPAGVRSRPAGSQEDRTGPGTGDARRRPRSAPRYPPREPRRGRGEPARARRRARRQGRATLHADPGGRHRPHPVARPL